MSKAHPTKGHAERREYFRIDDSIHVSYRVISEDELQQRQDVISLGVDNSFTIVTRMQAITQSLSASLHRVEQREPDVAEYLKSLDEKITLLGQAFLSEENDLSSQPSLPVNLSAGGMALNNPVALEVGSHLEIKLLLLPGYTGIIALGEVVGVDETEDDSAYPYHLRINFTHIRDEDQEALIRHILRRQGELLRQNRERRDLT